MPKARFFTARLERFAKDQARRFIRAAGTAANGELAQMTDGDIDLDFDDESASTSARITLTHPTAVIDETGTESRPPDPKISRLVKDRATRERIFKSAERALK